MLSHMATLTVSTFRLHDQDVRRRAKVARTDGVARMVLATLRVPFAVVPELRPFRGLRYDPRAVAADAAALLCPPYDVISPLERDRLAALDARNAVHVELPLSGTGEPGAAAYRHAARLFAEWQSDGTLRRDDPARVYGYEQSYVLPNGRQASARGFYCLLRLEPFGPQAGVRPHERTMAEPKEDRYQLLRAVRANLSPVVMLYEPTDDGARSAELLAQLLRGAPELEALDQAGLGQRLWSVDPTVSEPAAALLELASQGPLTIADGHHRYETALRFWAEERLVAGSGDGCAEWVMVLLFDARSGGLSVLPTHRFVQAKPDPAAVLEAAAELFEVTRIERSESLLDQLGRPGRLGLWTRAGAALLEPRREAVEPLLPLGASDALRWLDVTVLTSALPRLVGESAQALLESGRLAYIKDAQEVLARAARSEGGYAFLLPPTPVPAVLQVAAAGEQMPHKSTYFQPKPATGLVFNALAG
jgi:uncharacterized protein (DUF1015 family)